MKRQKRAKTTTMSVGSEPTLSSVAIRSGNDSNVAGVPAVRRMRYVALIVLLLMGAAIVGPQALYSQTGAAALSFANAQNTVASGLDSAYGVALDTKGDVFLTSGNYVLEYPVNGGAPTSIGSGLSSPSAVAVDGSGNVFIADVDNSRVVEVPANGGAQTTVGSGLSSPHGVAVDAAGDVFIADTANGRVVEVPVGGGTQTTVASGLTYPINVAVDAAGDVFVAGVTQLLKVPVGGSPVAIGSGFTSPQGVAVDAAGDLFVSDINNGNVVELPAGGGAQIAIAGGFNEPHQLAVDGAGDVFITDTFNNRVVEVERFVVKFANANVCPTGKTSPAPCSQTLAINYNVTTSGTVASARALTQGTPGLDFTVASNTCKGQLTAGSSCTLNVKFAPKAPGLLMGAAQLLNGSGTTPTILATTFISGEGQGPAVAFFPSPQTAVGTGLLGPYGVAVDAKGDVFIADSDHNRVVEVPAGGGAQTTIASGIDFPQAVAVDGAGDVFIAGGYSNDVVEVPAGGGAQTTVGSGFNYPTGVAVDGAGNLFISDFGNNRVVELPNGGAAQTTIGTGLDFPGGVAVDGAGDVFIADIYNNRVLEVPAGGGAQFTVGSGLSQPYSVAVDPAGDVFIADVGNNRVVEVPADGSAQITLDSGLVFAYGVAADAKGDVLIASESANTVVYLHRSEAPTLSFTSGVGKASYSQQVTVQSVGNQPLSAVTPGIKVGTDFDQVPGPGTPADCTSKFSLMPGATCNLSFTFTPPSTGSVKGTAVLTDNSLNAAAATQTITLNGTGDALLTPAVHVTGGPFVYNGLAESASCTATGGGAPVPGSCTFTYNGSTNQPVNAGTYTVIASFTSTDPYYGNATGTGKLTIDKAPLTVTANGVIYLQGTTFPTLTVNYVGFVDGQTQTVLTGTLKITTTATTSSAVGNYPIVPSGLTAPNYKITFVNGTLAVMGPTGLSGTYAIQNVNSGLLLGVLGASTAEGADIVQWSSTGSLDQQWTLTLAANGAYLIHNVNSQYVIGVFGASTSQGATLVQWQSNGSPDQEWQFAPVGSNWIITDVNSGLKMDIQGASTANGAQAFQWPLDGSPSQLWTLTLISAPLPPVQ